MTERNERLYNPEQPGAGAAEFATAMLAGLPEESREETANALIEKRLHDATDPRIKDCGFCGFLYRDKTKPNNSKTCSKECKAKFTAENKRNKRHAEGRFHEYRASNYEKPFANDKIEYIAAARQRYEHMGGRRGRRYAEDWRDCNF